MGWKDFAKKAGRMMVMGEVDVIGGIRRQKKLAESGVSTTALCTAFSAEWDRDEGDPRWGSSNMDLQVTPPGGGEPYPWSGEIWVRVALAKQVDPGLALKGKSLPVRVDGSDPQAIAVDWDAVEPG